MLWVTFEMPAMVGRRLPRWQRSRKGFYVVDLGGDTSDMGTVSRPR
jgi:hypothetical protein